MAVNHKFSPYSTGRPRTVHLSGTILIGGSGAVTSSVGENNVNPVVKTAAETGRYTVTLDRKYKNPRPGPVTVVGDTDAAFGANGYIGAWRNITTQTVSTTDVGAQTFDIQITDAAGADTNPASGYVIVWHLWVQE